MDNTLASRPFPGHTLAELEAAHAAGNSSPKMAVEIARRKALNAAAAGEPVDNPVGLLFPAERLRFAKTGKLPTF